MKTATRPTTIKTTDMAPQIMRLPRKSILVDVNIRIMFSFFRRRVRSKISNTTREQNTAEYMLIKMPRINVTAKPLIWSVPIA